MTVDTTPDTRHTMTVLGVPVSIVNMAGILSSVAQWDSSEQPHFILVRDVPSLMRSRIEPHLLKIHQEASLVVPDGQPLTWIGRARGYGQAIARTPGSDIVDAICRASLADGRSHFFYGGKPGVADRMASKLMARYPGLKVVGTLSPPMREIGPDWVPDSEALSELSILRAANADFVWVGISSPKQEYWISRCSPIIGSGVFLGVGAAFDFHSGSIARAPSWMRNYGLEWLHRLWTNPRRLWHRYLVLSPQFAVLAALELAAERLRRQLKITN